MDLQPLQLLAVVLDGLSGSLLTLGTIALLMAGWNAFDGNHRIAAGWGTLTSQLALGSIFLGALARILPT